MKTGEHNSGSKPASLWGIVILCYSIDRGSSRKDRRKLLVCQLCGLEGQGPSCVAWEDENSAVPPGRTVNYQLG